MRSFERRNRIFDILLKDGFVDAKTLSNEYKVSMETIRKDLLSLEESGVAYKEHGGAKLSSVDVERPINVRMDNSSSKKQIAYEAIKLLKEIEVKVVFIDAGSTCQELAKALNHMEGLDIITNSILVYEAIDDRFHNVLLTGGKKRTKNMSLVGRWTVNAIESVHADICFIGTSGIYDRKGPTSHSYQEIESKMAMIKNSDLVYVLADNQKFKESGFHTMCSWDEIDGIITDSSLSLHNFEKVNKEVAIIIAEEDN